LFTLTWKQKATPLGRPYCQLVASGLRTSDSDYGSWATPMGQQANGEPEAFLEKKRRSVARGSQMGVSLTDLQMQAKLASWPTPQTRDFRSGGEDRVGNPDRSNNLNDYVLMASLGPISSGSPAQTESKGQLNPAFSLWLMGYPPEWLNSAPQATRLSRKSRQNLLRQAND
jgi:hypothetical protein